MNSRSYTHLEEIDRELEDTEDRERYSLSTTDI
jgi:hypothetical protein